jgi:hypothetical protein
MTAQLDRPAPWRPGPVKASSATANRYPWNPHHGLRFAAGLAVALLLLNLLVAASAEDVIPAALRVVLVLVGMGVLPGLPLVTMLRIPARSVSIALVIGVSLAVNILVTQWVTVAQWGSPIWTQFGLAAFGLATCVVAGAVVPFDTSSVDNRILAARSWSRRRWVHLSALAVSTGLFVWAAFDLDIDAAGHFGIISAITPTFVLGLVVLAVVLASSLLARRIDHLTMALGTVLLITYNTMLVAAATGQTSVPTAFVHRGFVDVIAQGGQLPEKVDARFSWAGFFSAAAHLVEVTGISGIGGLLVWAPLVTGALLAVPLYAIAIVITGRVRLAWTAVVLYQLFNWYQQDYFAPQAIAMYFYTTVVATLLWQLRYAPLPPLGRPGLRSCLAMIRRTPGRLPGFGPARTLAVAGALLLLITANTVTHQITPILLIVAVAWFSLLGATRYRTLWLAAGLVFAAWFSYGASDFWLGHLQSLLDEVGQVGNSVNRGVGQRLNGDPTYKQMQYLRIGASGLFVLVAFAGWLCFRRKRTWLIGAALCGSPFLLVALQSYGGEMLIRCFLLASPVLAPFAAMALAVVFHRVGAMTWFGSRRRREVAGLVVAASLLLVFGLIGTTNRGLNTAFEASTNEDVTVTDAFMADVADDVTVMSWSYAPHSVGIRRTLDPAGPKFGFIDSYPCLDNLSACALDREPDYIYITEQGKGMLELQYGFDEAELDRQIALITDSGRYVTDVQDGSVLILRRGDVAEVAPR